MTESISSSKSVRENARGHDLAIAISRIIEETRGKDIRILDLRSVTEVFKLDNAVISYAVYMYVCLAILNLRGTILPVECRVTYEG